MPLPNHTVKRTPQDGAARDPEAGAGRGTGRSLAPEGAGGAGGGASTQIVPSTSRVLGRLLVAAGAVTDGEVAAALDEQLRTRERLGEVLVRRGLDPEQVARALAHQLRLPYAPPPLAPEPAAVALVQPELARRLRVLPLSVNARGLRVATSEPLDLNALDDLQFQAGRRVEPIVASAMAIERAQAFAFGSRDVEAVLDRLPGRPLPAPDGAADEGELLKAAEAPPIVSLVELVLQRAVALGASDVHFEAGAPARVRTRIDGLLREVLSIPAHAAPAVVSRLKVMADLDIAVRRKPQDGRAAIRVAGRELSLRVSTLPSAAGEKVVLRLLDPENAARPLEELGLASDDHARLLRLLSRPHGLLLVTGPTGSGKTTTLYGALAILDRERRNIITLEDPVEYRLPGITQVQVHPRAGLSFAKALRAVLRQDPDVVMVGELRDRATLEVALAAALTGHLVLSTLHTNDAAGAVARLLDMGAAPYLVAAALIGVLAQRLARRLCPDCRVERRIPVADLAALGLPAGDVPVYGPGSCARCGGHGYRGRVGIFELLAADTRLRELILRRAPADALREVARDAGTMTLGQDAWRKLTAGATSLDEVRPLLALVADEAPVCPACGAPLRRDFIACPTCGTRLRRRCRCGVLLENRWRCCPACGESALE